MMEKPRHHKSDATVPLTLTNVYMAARILLDVISQAERQLVSCPAACEGCASALSCRPLLPRYTRAAPTASV